VLLIAIQASYINYIRTIKTNLKISRAIQNLRKEALFGCSYSLLVTKTRKGTCRASRKNQFIVSQVELVEVRCA